MLGRVVQNGMFAVRKRPGRTESGPCGWISIAYFKIIYDIHVTNICNVDFSVCDLVMFKRMCLGAILYI